MLQPWVPEQLPAPAPPSSYDQPPPSDDADDEREPCRVIVIDL